MTLVLGAIACGTRQLIDAGLFAGCPVLSLAVVLIGGPTPIPLYPIVYVNIDLRILSGVYLHHAERRAIDTDKLRSAAIDDPILLVIGVILPSQRDEFGTLPPHTRYHLEDEVVSHGLAVLMYAASPIARRFAEIWSALFKFVLLSPFAQVSGAHDTHGVALAHTQFEDQAQNMAPMIGMHGWGLCVVGALAVTNFNPEFPPGITFWAARIRRPQ